MQATATTFTPDLRPPKLSHSITEVGRVILELGSSFLLNPVLKNVPRGDGHSIIADNGDTPAFLDEHGL